MIGTNTKGKGIKGTFEIEMNLINLCNKNKRKNSDNKYYSRQDAITNHFHIHKRQRLPQMTKTIFSVVILIFCLLLNEGRAQSNNENQPPQFVLNEGQSEIVLRLKEGTPSGTLIYKLKGFDPDGDPLIFGLRGQIANELLRIENLGSDEANVYLRKELDREAEDEFSVILTLTDNFLVSERTQSLLILVVDINDNPPVFSPYKSTIKVPENGEVPLVLQKFSAEDRDEGLFGQVIYKLQLEKEDEDLFSISTSNGQGILKLLQPLDYERKPFYQIAIVAMDRANTGQLSATAAVIIDVVDLEDSPPQFVLVPSITRIDEDIPKGSFVCQVKAVDGDRGVSNKIKYSLLNEHEVFEIEAETGVVYTKSLLDREDPKHQGGSYILRIQATEQTKSRPRPKVNTEVTILLNDVNDERPTFKNSYYLAEIQENSPVGVPITFNEKFTPECVDMDLGINGTFILSTKGDGDIFEVSPSRGVNQVAFHVKVKNPARLDYEKIKEINFTLVAEEINGDHKSSVPISVKIINTNDHLPYFEKEIYEFFVEENCEPGTFIGKVVANDNDAGKFGTEGIRYTSLTGSIADELFLDPVSGVISTIRNKRDKSKSLLDRELNSIFYLVVEARDSSGYRNTAQITINLIDRNDNEPEFLQSRYEARIFENEREFISPLIVQARDNDLQGSNNSLVQYSIVAGNSENHFSIDKTTGKVGILRKLDFENFPVHKFNPNNNVKIVNLTIRANDMGIPPKFSLVPCQIFLNDQNDYYPIFEKQFYTSSIQETISGNTEILKVLAIDKDGSVPFNRVFYRITSGAQDKFVINPDTGMIALASGVTLDYNLQAYHTIIVTAIDGGGKITENPALINITIRDTNNKPPQFIYNNELDGEERSNIGGNRILYAKVLENSPKNHIITVVKAIDPDLKSRLIYKINFNQSEARDENGRLLKGFDLTKILRLEKDSGALKVVSNIDREIIATIKLSLMVEDIAAEIGAPQIGTTTMILSISDENDNEPSFLSSYSGYSAVVQENSKVGTHVLSISAEDSDLERTIKYSIIPSKEDIEKDSFALRIDSETGLIFVGARIDREKSEWINFTVKAEDSGKPKTRFALSFVTVKVLDENDNSPYFTDSISKLDVKEDAQVGTVIGKIEAKDLDSGQFGTVTYLLDRKSSHGKFSIDSDTGFLRVSQPLDREEIEEFSLVIQAWDNYRFGFGNGESRNAFKHIQIKLIDVNDCMPQFQTEGSKDECTSVTEFQQISDLITTIRATDDDQINSKNSQVYFKIKKGNDLELFKLEQNGKNSVKIMPRRSLKGFYGNYSIEIEAYDAGTPSLRETKEFKICIQDYNDNFPKFINPSQNFTIRVPENMTIGSTILQVRAIDNDIGENGIVRYRFRKDVAGHYEAFDISSTTGLITLGKTLNREKNKYYHIRIEAHDLGSPTPLSSDLDLTIKVRIVQPQFQVEEFSAEFNENELPGREKLKLPGTIDPEDEEESRQNNNNSSPVCYFILPDYQNSSSLFIIDPIKHFLATRVKLDREQKENHTLYVVATEDCLRGGRMSLSADSYLNKKDKTILKVFLKILDANDEKPRFKRKIFTGGITTSTDYGTEFMRVQAVDKDSPKNAKLKYFIEYPIMQSLTEGLSHLQDSSSLFVINQNTGSLTLNFDPQPEMKGHFIINLAVNDTGGLNDRAKAFVYLLREDQKVKITVRMNPEKIRQQSDIFSRTLSNVTGFTVNIDENFKFHENKDGSVDKTKTDFYIHMVHPDENSVLEVEQVLKLIDLNIEELDALFKDFNVIDTQGGSLVAFVGRRDEKNNLFLVYAAGAALFFGLLLIVVICLCFAMRAKYLRQLKAATVNAYGSNSTIIPRTNVPNTNVHSVEGSNPIWMQAYHNNWYKEEESIVSSDNSDTRDSLDENAITESASPPSSHLRSFGGGSSEGEGRNNLNRTNFHKNLIYNNRIDNNNTCLILKKHLETTEL